MLLSFVSKISISLLLRKKEVRKVPFFSFFDLKFRVTKFWCQVVPAVCSLGTWVWWRRPLTGFVKFRPRISTFKRAIFQTFWKVHCCPDFLFLKLETSNFGYLFIFWFPLTVQSFNRIGQHWFKTFYKGPPFDVFWFCNLPKIIGGTLIKCLISMLSNLAENLELVLCGFHTHPQLPPLFLGGSAGP